MKNQYVSILSTTLWNGAKSLKYLKNAYEEFRNDFQEIQDVGCSKEQIDDVIRSIDETIEMNLEIIEAINGGNKHE